MSEHITCSSSNTQFQFSSLPQIQPPPSQELVSALMSHSDIDLCLCDRKELSLALRKDWGSQSLMSLTPAKEEQMLCLGTALSCFSTINPIVAQCMVGLNTDCLLKGMLCPWQLFLLQNMSKRDEPPYGSAWCWRWDGEELGVTDWREICPKKCAHQKVFWNQLPICSWHRPKTQTETQNTSASERKTREPEPLQQENILQFPSAPQPRQLCRALGTPGLVSHPTPSIPWR